MRKSRLPGFAASVSLTAALAVTFAVTVPPAAGAASLLATASRLARTAPAGPAIAWGDDSKGELGDGGDTSRLVPVKVRLPAGVTVRQVSAGDGFSLALTATGKVLAWGAGLDGELGNGATTGSHLPVSVKLPAGVKVTAIAAGNSHGLAVTSRGRVLAWGDNAFGELGNGTTTSSDVPVSVRLPAGVRVAAVAGGEQFSLALTTAGKVLAWGRNEFGKLGDGTTTGSDVPVWVKLPARTVVTGIAAGLFHSLAVTASGHVLAWGFNGFGQLGGVSGRHHSMPVRVKLPAGTRVTAVSAGGNHSLALTSRGRVLAWGSNAFGTLCTGGGGQVRAHPARVRLPDGAKAAAVAGGIYHTVILTRAGRLFDCGFDQVVESAVPVGVHLPRGVTAFAVSQGSDAHHALAIVRAAG